MGKMLANQPFLVYNDATLGQPDGESSLEGKFRRSHACGLSCNKPFYLGRQSKIL